MTSEYKDAEGVSLPITNAGNTVDKVTPSSPACAHFLGAPDSALKSSRPLIPSTQPRYVHNRHKYDHEHVSPNYNTEQGWFKYSLMVRQPFSCYTIVAKSLSLSGLSLLICKLDVKVALPTRLRGVCQGS